MRLSPYADSIGRTEFATDSCPLSFAAALERIGTPPTTRNTTLINRLRREYGLGLSNGEPCGKIASPDHENARFHAIRGIPLRIASTSSRLSSKEGVRIHTRRFSRAQIFIRRRESDDDEDVASR